MSFTIVYCYGTIVFISLLVFFSVLLYFVIANYSLTVDADAAAAATIYFTVFVDLVSFILLLSLF